MSYELILKELQGYKGDVNSHIKGLEAMMAAQLGLLERKSLGEIIAETPAFKKFQAGEQEIFNYKLTPMEYKTAITGGGAANDPLVNTSRHTIAAGARRRLMVRDLLLAGQTSEGAVEHPFEATHTNNAGSQNRENSSFSESDSTFSLSFKPCETVGHYATVSKNLLQDSGVLNSYLQDTLIYGLRLKEESQIITGDGTSSTLDGLLNNASAYTVQSPQLANEIDVVRDAILQAELADYYPNAVILNPQDWSDIQTRKAGTSNDEYIAGDPANVTGAMLWNRPVITTNSITSGTFLTGELGRAAKLFDRQEAIIEFSYHNNENFRKGMVTMLATIRVSLVVVNGSGLITGSL